MVFDIELIGVNNPKVKRTLSVPASMTFQQLHGIIQIAFGWENEHLYDFQNRPKSLSGFPSPVILEIPDEIAPDSGFFFLSKALGGKKKSKDARTARLSEYFVKEGDYMVYTYDFGDNWEHKVTLTSLSDADQPDIPQCLSGEGMCPIEDCGGIPGWEDLKTALAHLADTPNNKDVGNDDCGFLEWAFGTLAKARKVDINKVSITKINKALQKGF